MPAQRSTIAVAAAFRHDRRVYLMGAKSVDTIFADREHFAPKQYRRPATPDEVATSDRHDSANARARVSSALQDWIRAELATGTAEIVWSDFCAQLSARTALAYVVPEPSLELAAAVIDALCSPESAPDCPQPGAPDVQLVPAQWFLCCEIFALSHELLGPLMTSLLSERKTLHCLYQAASIRDRSSLLQHTTHLHNRYRARRRWLRRSVLDALELSRAKLAGLALNVGDELVVWAAPEAVEDCRVAVDAHNREPGAGGALARELLVCVVRELFAQHRIASYRRGVLALRALPRDPAAYHFEVIGSSPPWALAEEKAWLMDGHGLRARTHRNILSVTELARLLLRQRTQYHNRKLFYVAQDLEHQVVFGSPYAGSGAQAVDMGTQIETFAQCLEGPGLRSASTYGDRKEFSTCLEAYENIRASYYTWAYYMAFTDYAYAWIDRALLISARRQGFAPLGFVGNTLLRGLVRAVGVAQRLPKVGPRLRNYFLSTIAADQKTIASAIESLDSVLADGRAYLLGREFTSLDLHICANLGNVIVPPEFHTGGVLAPLESYPPSYRAAVERFRESPTGRYVLRVYSKHRQDPAKGNCEHSTQAPASRSKMAG